jgi:hypothetical protein
MSLSDYKGGVGAVPRVEIGEDVYILVYNDTGAAVNNGDVFFLGYAVDADSLSTSTFSTLDACATSAIYRQIAVVNNQMLGSATIADQAWGYVQIRGYCKKVFCANTLAKGDYLQGANASAVAADDGTTITTDSFAVCTVAYSATTTACEAYLFGERTIIG